MGRPPHEERERAAPPPKLFHFLGCRTVTLRHVDGLALLKQRYQGFPVDHAQWRWRGSPSVGLAVGKVVDRQQAAAGAVPAIRCPSHRLRELGDHDADLSCRQRCAAAGTGVVELAVTNGVQRHAASLRTRCRLASRLRAGPPHQNRPAGRARRSPPRGSRLCPAGPPPVGPVAPR